MNYLKLVVSDRCCCDFRENLEHPETSLWVHWYPAHSLGTIAIDQGKIWCWLEVGWWQRTWKEVGKFEDIQKWKIGGKEYLSRYVEWIGCGDGGKKFGKGSFGPGWLENSHTIDGFWHPWPTHLHFLENDNHPPSRSGPGSHIHFVWLISLAIGHGGYVVLEPSASILDFLSQEFRIKTVFVSYSCFNKLPLSGWLQTTEIYSLTVLEARSLKSRHRQGCNHFGGFWGNASLPLPIFVGP